MDKEDVYFSTVYPEFYNVYKHDDKVATKFKDNLPRMLKDLANTFDVVNYGILDAELQTNGRIKSFSKPKRLNSHRIGIGMISLDTAFNSGHWCGWIYIPDKKLAYIYDSMMVSGNSSFVSHFKKVLHSYFPGIRVSTSPCATCKSVSSIRKKSHSRQPTGGFVNNEAAILQPVLSTGRELNNAAYKRILGYKSQHQYCYAEALMFIEDFLRQTPGSCKNPRDALIQIKQYIFHKLSTVMNKAININKFLYIYNPDTRRRNKIFYN